MPDRDLVPKDRQSSPASSPRGTNYLLAIAINDYLHCSKLNNAVRDAEALIQQWTAIVAIVGAAEWQFLIHFFQSGRELHWQKLGYWSSRFGV